MKKISSFMLMLMLCCISASAQITTGFENRVVKVGTAVDAMEPNTWYFLHTPRNAGSNASTHVMPGEEVNTEAGGLVTDKGEGQAVGVTTKQVLAQMASYDGIIATDYLQNLVRFVPADQDSAFYVQFGTGRYMAASPANGTVSQVQQVAGQAGKYNFYLIKLNGEPNKAGRFAWNVYHMAQRVDNNGAGSNVSLWQSGERVASAAESEPSDGSNIKSNNVWQIFQVEDLGEVNYYKIELDKMLIKYMEIVDLADGEYIEGLKNGVNVGDTYGNYRTADVEAFLAIHNKVEEYAGLYEADITNPDAMKEYLPTIEDVQKLIQDYTDAHNKVLANKIPLAVTDIKPGYYTLDNIVKWTVTKNDTIFFDEESANEYNTQQGLSEGDEGYKVAGDVKEVITNTVDANVKSLYSKNKENGEPHLAWGEKKPTSAFLWKIDKVAGSDTKYRLVNMYQNRTFRSVSTGALVEDDTVAVYFDFRGEREAPVVGGNHVVYSIRNTYNTAESGQTCYVHCGGHSSGAGKEGWIVAWYGDSEASQWYLTAVDDATAEQWMESDEDRLNKKLAEAAEIMKNAPAQLEIAKDILVTIHEEDSMLTADHVGNLRGFESIIDGNNTDPKNIEGFPAKTDAEETLAYLLDGDGRTYWHTKWTSNQPVHTHYLQVEAPEIFNGTYAIKITRRAGADNDHATKLAVRAYDEDDAALTFDQGEDLGVLDIPFTGKGHVDFSTNCFTASNKKYIRFYWEASNGTHQRGYWHAAEFNIYTADAGTVHEGNSQYAVRNAEAKALEAAMAKWAEGNYDNSDVELVNNPEFIAAHQALVDAYNAWSAVYVNPTALRNAIKAAPAAELFVKGDNPGQWAEGAYTPVAVIEAAKKYDAACAYTAAESEKMIQDIQEAVAKGFQTANKIETGVWYRFKFPAEETYEQFGWAKTGAQEAFGGVDKEFTVSPALFGKTVAAAKGVTTYEPFTNAQGNPDTVATYKPAVAEEFVEGQGMYFFPEEDMSEFTEGEDLFRFIQATDSSYIIQNKATGMFIHGEHAVNLSAVPTYFSTKAIGAGANIVSYTTVLGEKPNNHVNLHGQRSDNRLVCWEANTLGSNSMILIEKAEEVTEEPENTYFTKLWRGSAYTKVSPVDTKIIEGATAYSAELVLGEDTAVVLKSIDTEVIKAGTPYVIIADMLPGAEYITPGDRKNEIIQDIISKKGSYGYNEKMEANNTLDAEYARVEMEHGMQVDTIQKGMGHLVGTFRSITVKAGKALVTKANGFAHTINDTNIDANRAYLACDFNAESTDVLGSITIKIEGSVDTGIDNVLNNVAKSGNIYTVDGKLVGKGNINTINRLPAGIYIINGMKVVKK